MVNSCSSPQIPSRCALASLREIFLCKHCTLPPHFILIKQHWIIVLTMFQDMSNHQPAKPARTIRYFIFLQIEVNECILFLAHHKVNFFGSELSVDTFTFFIRSFHCQFQISLLNYCGKSNKIISNLSLKSIGRLTRIQKNEKYLL